MNGGRNDAFSRRGERHSNVVRRYPSDASTHLALHGSGPGTRPPSSALRRFSVGFLSDFCQTTVAHIDPRVCSSARSFEGCGGQSGRGGFREQCPAISMGPAGLQSAARAIAPAQSNKRGPEQPHWPAAIVRRADGRCLRRASVGRQQEIPGLPLAGRAFLSQFAGYSMVWGKIADLSRDEIQR